MVESGWKVRDWSRGYDGELLWLDSWVHILALPPASWVTWGWLFAVSEPLFLHLQTGGCFVKVTGHGDHGWLESSG